MRIGISLAACALLVCGASSAQSIRSVDFKNFSYAWSAEPGWSDHMEWQNALEENRIKVVNGKMAIREDDSEQATDIPPRFEGLTLEEVAYGDATGDGKEEAIVVFRYDSGGTQFSYFVYIYALKADKPILLAWFHAGDRASNGLYRVYAQGGKLVVELFDPEKRSGDCCSDGFNRTRYRWRKSSFVAVGPIENGIPKAPSRIPVSIFGIHQ